MFPFAFFILPNFVFLSFLSLAKTSADVGISVERMYCDFLLSTDEELSEKGREKIKKKLAVEYLKKTIKEEIDNGKQNWGKKEIYEEMEQKYWQIGAKTEEITDGNGDDQLDNFISQLSAMLSKVKMANIGQKGGLFGTDFENKSEEKEKPTKSHEKEWNTNFDRDLAEWHQQNLEKMLAQSTRPKGKGKLSEYFDPQKAKWENELTFRLRQFATLGDEEHADKRMKLALARMLEIVGGMPSLFGTLSIIYFEFTSQLDVLNWLLRSYFDFLFAASQLATRKALLSIDLLVFLKSIDQLVRQKGAGREFGWNSFRMELAQFFDHIQLIGRESDILSIELECIVKFLLFHRLEKELERMPKVGEGWTVSAFLNVPDQNEGQTLDTKIEQMRHRLERENAEQFEKFVDTKKEFRIGLKRLSGVQLVRRLLALLGHSQMSKIGKLIRKSRNLEAIPEWYLDTKHFKVDVCPNFENGKVVDTYRDTDGIELVKMYEGFLEDSKLFLSIHAKGASKESLFGEETVEIKNENLKIVKKAALWLIDNFVDEFLAYLDNFFEFGGNQKEKDRILNEIWQKWVETNAKMQTLKEQGQLFCHIYVFSMFFLSTIWQRLGEKERKKMAKVMAEKRWDQITIFALRWYGKSSLEFGRSSAAFATCDYSQWDELLHHRNAQLVHSLTLFRLIKRFKGFAHFLCQMIKKDTVETKDRLLLLFRSVAEFDWLEKQFPMILRIEELNFRCRLHFYEQMFKFKSSSDSHRYSEFRMAFSVLFKQLSVRLTAKSAKLAHPMLTEVMFVVHEDIFREIGTCVGICRLMLLLKGIECRQNEVENDGESRQFEISTEQLEQCVKSGAKLEQFGTFWETIRKNHIEFLMGSKGNAFPLLIAASSVVDTALGAKARIGKIVGDKAYKAFWDKGLSAFVETQTFDKEVVLIDHYLIALLIGETEISRMTNKLAADLSVFVHWSDSEPKGAKMDKFWQKKRTIEMHRMYDGLFDVELEVEMTKIALAFEETIKGMKGFLEANRNAGIEKKLAEEWDKMAKKADKETKRRADEMPKRTNWNNLMDATPKWVKELHAAKFKKYADKRLGRETENAFFVHPGEILINGLKKGLESCYIEVKRRLGWFMEEEQMKELLEKLGIPFEREQIEEKRERIGSDDGEEKRKKSNRVKKMKRKKNKEKEMKGMDGKEEEEEEKVEEKSKREDEEEGKKEKEEGERKNGWLREKEERRKENMGEKEEKDGGKGKNGREENGEEGTEEKVEAMRRKAEDGENGKKHSDIPVAKCQFFGMNGKIQKVNERVKKEKNDQRKGGRPINAKSAKKSETHQTKEGKASNEEEKEAKSIDLLIEDITTDEFLLEKHRKNMNVNNDHNLDNELLANLSVYAHEIKQQMETYKQLSNYGTEFRNWAKNVTNEWQNKMREKVPKERNERIELMNELCRILHRMANFGEKFYDQNWDNCTEQMQIMCSEVKGQLHKRHLSRQITENDQLEKEWAELTKEGQIKAIDTLWGEKNGNRKAKGNRRKEFVAFLEQWRKMRDQMELDENLREYFAEKGYLEQKQSENGNRTNQAEYLQEIEFEKCQQKGAKTEEQMLDELLYDYGILETNEKRNDKIKTKIEEMRRIVKEWSDGLGVLLIGGSFLLGVHTAGSDIDTVCVMPGQITAEQFFGTCNCTPRERSNCDDKSLLCALCTHLNVQSLQRIPFARVPLLKVTLSCGLKIDVLFASIPGLKSVNIDERNSAHIANLIEKLTAQLKKENSNDRKDREKEKQTERMVRSLAGYQSNLKLLEVNQKNMGTFRKFVLILKLWAKHNYIYGNLLGFFGGVSFAVLATKIVLLYPGASVPFLLKRFFLTFSLWEWPLPVQIAEISPDSLSWSPEGELELREAQFGLGFYAKMTMPVIAPGTPEQNTTFNVNMLTAKIIGKTMREAFNRLHFVRHKSQKEKWREVLGQRKFSQMYSHFFVVICVGSDNELNDEFCGFVATRIRPLLLTSGQCAHSETNVCHATQMDQCLGEIVQFYRIRYHPLKRHTVPYAFVSRFRSANAICKAWVVGVNLKNDLPGDEKGKATHSDQLGINGQIYFGEQILDIYKKTILGKTTTNRNSERIRKFLTQNSERDPKDFVHLESKFVDRKEIAKSWRI